MDSLGNQTNDGAAPGTTRTEAAPDSARTHSSGTGGAAEKHMRSMRNLADIKGTLGGQEKGGQENGAAAKAADKPPPSFAKALGAIAPKMVHNLKSMTKEPPPKDVVDAHRKQHDVDDIKARTMYRMVDETPDGKKMVFFNNRQAGLFSMENIETLLEAFTIESEPKLVIRLLPSSCGSETLAFMSERVKQVMASERDETYGERLKEAVKVQVEHDPDSIGDSPVPDLMAQPCYLDEHRQAASEWNLELFCREILVPLAIETKALVIGNCFADDALYMAFCKAAEAVKAKYSGKLPFTTFGMADAPCLSMACVTDGTTTRKMFDNCISWRQRYAKILEAIGKNPDADELFGDIDHMIDMNPGVDNFIVTDCVDEIFGKVEGVKHEAKDKLTQTLLQYLVSQLPAIAVGTMHHYDAKYGGMHCSSMFNLTQVNIPVLLLDVRAKETYPKDLQGQALLDEAVKRHTARVDIMRASGKEDLFECCRIAHFHQLLTHGAKGVDDKNQPKVELWRAIRFKKDQKASSGQSPEHRAMLMRITDFLLEEEYKAYWGLLTQEQMRIAREEGVKDHKDFYRDLMKQAKMHYYNLLCSPGLYSANVVDTDRLHGLVRELCSIDKLPKTDSLEALLVVRHAWDTIDVGRKVLWWYKFGAKACYFMLVLFAIATTTVTVLASDINALSPIDGGGNDQDIRYSNHQLLVFLISTATALVAAFQAFINPLKRWHQLRDITSTLESEMWRYRTRTGIFTMANGPSGPTQRLKQTVEEAWKKVVAQADVSETSFWRQHSHKTYLHNQYDPDLIKPSLLDKFLGLFGKRSRAKVVADEMERADEWDDNYSPLQPDKYIHFRVEKMLAFYRLRIPRYSLANEVFNGLLMASSAAGAIIAFTWIPEYVAIITAVTAGIMSWVEFSSVNKKLARYNGSVVELESIVLWWQSISAVDRASPLQIEKLISLCEKAINAERTSWLSSTASDDEKQDKKSDMMEVKKENDKKAAKKKTEKKMPA